MRTTLLLALTACLAVLLPSAAAQFVDPNRQADGVQAGLTGDKVAGNPLGLVSAVAQQEGMDPPNGGVTFSSQHNAEVSLDAENLWTWEFDGYNVENVGLTTLHNLKDPSWPVVMTLFTNTSSPDFAPIETGEFNVTWLDEMVFNLTDGAGNVLGYTDIFAATNDSALGVVARMASDPTQAIFGVMGQDTGASDLKGGIDQPLTDDTFIPLSDEEIAALPDPASLKDPSATPAAPAAPTPASPAPVPASPTPSSPNPAPSPVPVAPYSSSPSSAGSALQANIAIVAAALVGLIALLY